MTLEASLKLLAAVGAVASFLWGVWVWKDKTSRELHQQAIDAEQQIDSRRIEATKPFLEQQLKLYSEATAVSSMIASDGASAEAESATKRFWQLYWGELALVENREVEAAMLAMGRAISDKDPGPVLQARSLDLAMFVAVLSIDLGESAPGRPRTMQRHPELRSCLGHDDSVMALAAQQCDGRETGFGSTPGRCPAKTGWQCRSRELPHHKALREAPSKRGMTMADLEEDLW